VDDTLADFSNWGDGVEVAAPGVCVYSTVPGGYGTKSGTSMAAPHVTGALALLASEGPATGRAGVMALYAEVVDAGNLDWNDADDPDATKEPLLDVGDAAAFAPRFADTEPPPPAGGTLTVARETYRAYGGKQANRNLDVAVAVTDGSAAVAAATVTIALYRQGTAGWSLVATRAVATDSAGTAAFTFRDVGAGCYAADVESIARDGYAWDGVQPVNTSCAGVSGP
jgi:subtilisin family serine protease